MATKKAQPKAAVAAAPSSDMSSIWKWLYIVSILAASLAGAFGFQNTIVSIIFALIGFVVGLFFFETSEMMNVGLRYLIVTAAAGSLGVIPGVGSYLTGFFSGFAAFLGPVVLGMAVMFFWKKYFGSM